MGLSHKWYDDGKKGLNRGYDFTLEKLFFWYTVNSQCTSRFECISPTGELLTCTFTSVFPCVHDSPSRSSVAVRGLESRSMAREKNSVSFE